jgi:hypothetical protein
MKKPIVNMAASVHARLLRRAKAEGRPFNELLQIEEFLMPVVEALVDGSGYDGRWPPGGPWNVGPQSDPATGKSTPVP